MNHWRKVSGVRVFANEPHLLCAVLIGCITDSPEVTGGAFYVPSSTSYQSTITPGTSSPASSPSSSSLSKSNSNAGSLAGGVVGGIVGVALIAGLVARFTIIRRRRHALSADHIRDQGSNMGGVVPYPMNTLRPKLYVSLFFCHLAM
jgi:hypothetical protein